MRRLGEVEGTEGNCMVKCGIVSALRDRLCSAPGLAAAVHKTMEAHDGGCTIALREAVLHTICSPCT